MSMDTCKTEYLIIEQSPPLCGEVPLFGSKNATLPIMASLILTQGRSVIKNVPLSSDVLCMCTLLEQLGARITSYSSSGEFIIDTTSITNYKVDMEIMRKMRASVLVMGPLLARFGKAQIALPGGCSIGARPIDYHLTNFEKMGVRCTVQDQFLEAVTSGLKPVKLILDYPSVGATENILMAATLTQGKTTIVNAALEPEVLDLICVLRKMGAFIEIVPPATLVIHGTTELKPIEHSVIYDRLEAGSLLVAASITGGEIYLPDAREDHLNLFLTKLQEMGHRIITGPDGNGIRLIATDRPRAISFVTAPFPGYPTDLQAPMMAALSLAQGTSIVRETVFENRLIHVEQLKKLGADIRVEGDKAIITGVKKLYGTSIEASDIRASCALALAGLAAHGTTRMKGYYHWRRGYQALEQKLKSLGANIQLETTR